MTTLRQQILDAIVAQVGTPEGCRNIYLHLENPLAPEDLPALLVGWTSDSRSQQGMYDLHKLEVTIQAIASGESADADADSLIAAAYAKLLESPRSLGGLVKRIAPGDATRDASEQGQVSISQTFTIDYLTTDASLSTQP